MKERVRKIDTLRERKRERFKKGLWKFKQKWRDEKNIKREIEIT